MEKGSFSEIRYKLLDKLIFILSLIVIPTLVFSIGRYLTTGWLYLYTIQTFLAITMLLVSIYRKRMPYFVKVTYLTLFFLALSIIAVIYLELSGFFLEFMMLSVLIVVIFDTRKTAIIYSFFCALMIVLLGYLSVERIINSEVNLNDFTNLPLSWVNVFSAWILMVSMVIISTGDIGRLLSNKVIQLIDTTKKLDEARDMLDKQNIELRKNNIKLSKANATKSKLFRIIAHDLRNPISQMIQYSELLNDSNYRLSESKKQLFIKAINESSHRGYDLLINLLDWARTQTDEISFDPDSYCLLNLINESVSLLNQNLTSKNHSVIINIDENIEVYVDKQMVSVIIRNLISNAIKFTNDNGEINITAVYNNDTINISFRDNGIGMSSEVKNNLFVLESIESRKGTNNETGTGLGLLLCKEFAERNGGSIEVESVENEGSCFILSLPEMKK